MPKGMKLPNLGMDIPNLGMKLPKDCPKCGKPMLDIIAAVAQQRNGWYCVEDRLFIKAIGRERHIKKGTGNGRAEKDSFQS